MRPWPFAPAPENVARELVARAKASPDREICGFITHDWELRPINNIAEGDREFIMDEQQMVGLLEETGGDLLGVYHSHPGGDPHPSDADETFSYANYFRYFIVTAQSLYEWRFTNGGPRSVSKSGIPLAENVAYPLLTTTAKVRHAY
jgi:proteasome lid subunit RPN8/RPN11